MLVNWPFAGLDPAGPSFDSYDIMIGLNPWAANFVDAIHTDGWGLTPAYYGTLEALGHIDFYPNKGYHQPACWSYAVQGGSDTRRKTGQWWRGSRPFV